jgi:hypothetical protein
MSLIKVSGNASGTGTFEIAAPNSNTNRTLTLPDATGTVVLDTATQTLTNKTIQGGAITSGTAVASTSGTSIDFTSIPSWVKRITVMFNGVSTSGTSPILIQLGDSGGVENTGYVSLAAQITASTVTNTTSTAGLIQVFAAVAANTLNGSTIISLFDSNTWVSQGCSAYTDRQVTSAGSKTLSATLDRVRITTVGGTDTFDAGSINILYE